MNYLDWSIIALLWILICALLKRDIDVNVTTLSDATRNQRIIGRVLAPIVQAVAYLMLPFLFVVVMLFGTEKDR